MITNIIILSFYPSMAGERNVPFRGNSDAVFREY